MDKRFRYLLYYSLGVLILMTIFNFFFLNHINTEEITYSRFQQMLEAGEISQVSIESNRILILPSEETG
ncbi:MAG TPA: ATP-dependent metallopeptidase FtsH/Yme1/Tma family protein, partial [Mesotoga sp.]|nr:ATP-dependent metallopeptidase FtsH/Yme1/Tma family protein [Mesotoga sp.]